jgi:hypothetical protein
MTATSSVAPTRLGVVAGIAYFALVFGLGFVLGTVRTLIVADAPGGGRVVGVLIELPVMIAASWFLCRFVIGRFAFGMTVLARAVMGGVALGLLLLAELAVAALLFGRTPAEHFALYTDASYAPGLAAQLAFALMPLLQLRVYAASSLTFSQRTSASRSTHQ